MGEAQIPYLSFTGEALDLKQERTEAWKALSNNVREACETHGCFLLSYDGIPADLCQRMFVAAKPLFDLPEETKNKYTNPDVIKSHITRSPANPLLESFGIGDAQRLEEAQAFTHLMWPNGNLSFCETLNLTSSKMMELCYILLKMLFESLGMEMYYGSHVEADAKSTFRLFKYNAPPSNEEGAVGLEAHTDIDIITILCQNEVQGLEIKSREGIWSQVTIPKGCFTVIVGEALKVWSNGRLHAVKHRVTLSRDEDRYSLGCFLLPKRCIEVPREMVDEDHPLLYRPFTFSEYIFFFLSCKDADKRDKALELYAGA